MRRRVAGVGAAALVAGCLAAGFLAGCGRSTDSAVWSDGGGLTLQWSPAEPRFGDRVRLEAAKAAGEPMAGLFDPSGAELPNTGVRYTTAGERRVWEIRAESVGPWTWGKDGRTLWTVETVAGSATDLKTLDAQSLWDGK